MNPLKSFKSYPRIIMLLPSSPKIIASEKRFPLLQFTLGRCQKIALVLCVRETPIGRSEFSRKDFSKSSGKG